MQMPVHTPAQLTIKMAEISSLVSSNYRLKVNVQHCGAQVTRCTDLTFVFHSAERLRIVIHPESNVEVDNGHTTLYFCASYGFPLPSISWVRNGSTLANGSHTSINQSLVSVGGVTFVKSSLEVCGVEENNDTLYVCIADNEINMANFEISLLVAATGKHFLVK